MRSLAALTTRRQARIAIACATLALATAPVAAEPIAATTPIAKRAAGKRAVHKPVVLARVAFAAQRSHPDGELIGRLWPYAPVGRGLSLSEQITERLTQIGNTLGAHLDLLSQDMFQLRVDCRRQRARFRLGGGDPDDVLTLRFAGDVQFSNLNARVDAYVELGVRGHLLRLELPAFQVQAAEYRGDYGMQLEVPVFERRF